MPTLEQITAMVEEANRGSRTRKLTPQEVKEILDRAVALVQALPEYVRGFVALEYNPHSVAKAYKSTAWGTVATCQFDKTGTPVKLKIERGYVGNYPKVRLVLFEAVRLQEALAGLDRKAQNAVIRDWGFHPGSMYKKI